MSSNSKIIWSYEMWYGHKQEKTYTISNQFNKNIYVGQQKMK